MYLTGSKSDVFSGKYKNCYKETTDLVLVDPFIAKEEEKPHNPEILPDALRLYGTGRPDWGEG